MIEQMGRECVEGWVCEAASECDDATTSGAAAMGAETALEYTTQHGPYSRRLWHAARVWVESSNSAVRCEIRMGWRAEWCETAGDRRVGPISVSGTCCAMQCCAVLFRAVVLTVCWIV